MTDTHDSEGPVGSILGDLAARRRTLADEQRLTLPVPRWTDPEIVVEFHLIPHEDIRKHLADIDDAKKRDKGKVELLANCDILIQACTAVFAVVEGKRYSLRPGDATGTPTTFDRDLGVQLGLDEHAATARQVVRSLYIADGDILSAAGTVIEFCGYKRDAIEEVIEGES